MNKVYGYLLFLSCLTGGALMAQTRSTVQPFPQEQQRAIQNQRSAGLLGLMRSPGTAPHTEGILTSSAAEWLMSQRFANGSFPWTPGDATAPPNIQGPCGRGVLKAYQQTYNTSYLTAAIKTGDYLVPIYPRTFTDGDPRFATHDPLFLEELSSVTGDPKYSNFVQTYFWDKLKSGTYGESNNLDAAGFGDLVVDTRNSWGQVEVSPWDLSATAIAAHVAGETSVRDALMSKILRGLNLTTTSNNNFDVIGLAGAIWASAVTGVNLDPTTGAYASANSTQDLITILLSAQRSSDGAFIWSRWNSACDSTDPANGDVQTTAFAIMALNAFNRNLYAANIARGYAFIKSQQQASGQFLEYPGALPNAAGGVEVHAEALSALVALATSVVYVDDNWAGLNPGDPADGHTFGLDAFATIQDGINAVTSGGTVNVAPGTYVEGPQIVINTDLSIIGADKATTIIRPSANTGSSGDARGWFLVNSAITFNLSNVTLDGTGYKVWQAIRHKGFGTISNCAFANIQFEPSGPSYSGLAIAAFDAPGNIEITNCTFTGIGRVGVLFFGSGKTGIYSNNTYTGKGTGNWLDYGVEVGGGAHATIINSVISGNRGVASVDGSTSSGILVTTYYGAGTEATITGNTLTNNTEGITVGYDASDNSSVVAHFNNITGNGTGVSTTAPLVNAEYNWWGSSDGPGPVGPGSGDKVSANVDFTPWLTETYAPTKLTETATGTGTVSFTPSEGVIEDLTAISESSLPGTGKPRGITFPNGLFSFKIVGLTPGATVVVTMTLPSPTPIGTQYWKYQNGSWIDCTSL
ncbi:MAG: choice-of-anchor U domain-containing protein, partial [Armatimonadota bacterium]